MKTTIRSGAARGAGAVAVAVAAALVPQSWANGINENGSWQFQTSQDRVNKGAIVDLIERKKGGFYDSFKTTVNNNSYTYIDRQINCTLSSSASGNAGTNAMDAATSSPGVSNSSNTSANTAANTATNGISQAGFPGVLVAGTPTYPSSSSLGNNQSNSGTLSSGVSGSATNSTTGAISADGGRTDQVLNSTQNNTGAQASSITGSTACNGPIGN
jgi:hypothetical protein